MPTPARSAVSVAISVGLAILVIAGSAVPARGQQRTLGAGRPFDSTGVGDTSLFAPLRLASVNAFRDGSGAPGARYWEQRADYDLKATLDTGAKQITGQETIRYTNNSPDTLRFVWMQVEQNAFKSGSLNSYVFPPDSRFGALNFEGGDIIDHFNQVTGAAPNQAHKPLVTHVDGTQMRVDLLAPLAPGQTATFDVAWHFLVPEHGADRMGRDGALYEIAQWYPRLCVYDDLRGWNTEPYLGQGEFYLEYGDFNLEVTVPAGYIIGATGMLQNPHDVLTAAEISRLAQAAKSETPIHIITQDELKSGAARPKKTGTLTWKFHATNVRDEVFATSPDYLWDASSYNGHLAQAYYRPSAIDTWKDGADMARMSIMEYSERWYPYPYPQVSVVEGPVSGMEYPMLAMEDKSDDKYGLYNVITHEVGHNWFPMLVGSNERLYFWQDEGLNTFINTFSEARRFPEKGDQMQRAAEQRREIEAYMRAGADGPMMVPPDRIDPNLLGEAEYDKTSVALQQLRMEVLGPDTFDAAFKEYIRRWAGKHPTPSDFFRTIEDVAGKDLDWFWREWWFTNVHFDQAIDSVLTRQVGDTMKVAVLYGNRARGVSPIRVRFTFDNGSTQDYVYPAEVWSTDTRNYIRQYSFVGKKVTKLQLDPEHRLVDIDTTNNTWVIRP